MYWMPLFEGLARGVGHGTSMVWHRQELPQRQSNFSGDIDERDHPKNWKDCNEILFCTLN
jgi:hypothetical protein